MSSTHPTSPPNLGKVPFHRTATAEADADGGDASDSDDVDLTSEEESEGAPRSLEAAASPNAPVDWIRLQTTDVALKDFSVEELHDIMSVSSSQQSSDQQRASDASQMVRRSSVAFAKRTAKLRVFLQSCLLEVKAVLATLVTAVSQDLQSSSATGAAAAEQAAVTSRALQRVLSSLVRRRVRLELRAATTCDS